MNAKIITFAQQTNLKKSMKTSSNLIGGFKNVLNSKEIKHSVIGKNIHDFFQKNVEELDIDLSKIKGKANSSKKDVCGKSRKKKNDFKNNNMIFGLVEGKIIANPKLENILLKENQGNNLLENVENKVEVKKSHPNLKGKAVSDSKAKNIVPKNQEAKIDLKNGENISKEKISLSSENLSGEISKTNLRTVIDENVKTAKSKIENPTKNILNKVEIEKPQPNLKGKAVSDSKAKNTVPKNQEAKIDLKKGGNISKEKISLSSKNLSGKTSKTNFGKVIDENVKTAKSKIENPTKNILNKVEIEKLQPNLKGKAVSDSKAKNNVPKNQEAKIDLKNGENSSKEKISLSNENLSGKTSKANLEKVIDEKVKTAKSEIENPAKNILNKVQLEKPHPNLKGKSVTDSKQKNTAPKNQEAKIDLKNGENISKEKISLSNENLSGKTSKSNLGKVIDENVETVKSKIENPAKNIPNKVEIEKFQPNLKGKAVSDSKQKNNVPKNQEAKIDLKNGENSSKEKTSFRKLDKSTINHHKENISVENNSHFKTSNLLNSKNITLGDFEEFLSVNGFYNKKSKITNDKLSPQKLAYRLHNIESKLTKRSLKSNRSENLKSDIAFESSQLPEKLKLMDKDGKVVTLNKDETKFLLKEIFSEKSKKTNSKNLEQHSEHSFNSDFRSMKLNIPKPNLSSKSYVSSYSDYKEIFDKLQDVIKNFKILKTANANFAKLAFVHKSLGNFNIEIESSGKKLKIKFLSDNQHHLDNLKTQTVDLKENLQSMNFEDIDLDFSFKKENSENFGEENNRNTNFQSKENEGEFKNEEKIVPESRNLGYNTFEYLA